MLDIDRAVVAIAGVEVTVEACPARAEDAHVLRDAFLKPGDGHEYLEGRAGCELGLDGAVEKRVVGVGDQLGPIAAVDADREGVGIVAGMRDHGQNLAVTRVHRHHRAIAVAQRHLGRALNVDVDGQLQVLARSGVLRAQVAYLAAVAVHNNVARAVLAAQQCVVGLFDPGLAHHVAGHVVSVPRIVQIVFTHFAHIADL